MGGFGSGGHNTRGAATCESCPSIDLAWLRRRGHTEPRSLLDAGLVAREKFASFRRGASRERSCSEACSSRPRPLLVTFGTGIRTNDLGRIGRNVPSAAKPRYQQAAETKHARPERGPEPEPDRPKAMHSDGNDLRTNDFSPLLQPSYTPASAVPAGCGGDSRASWPICRLAGTASHPMARVRTPSSTVSSVVGRNGSA